MRYLFLVSFIFSAYFGLSQDKKIDQLEILYDQGYYTKVLRKSSKLLANPEYDYSGLPSLYKSMSLFRLANDESWFKRNNYAVDEAIKYYDDFMENERIGDYLVAHYHEISSLKTYLVDLQQKFEKLRYNGSAEAIQSFRLTQLKGIKASPDFKIEEVGSGSEEVAKQDGTKKDDDQPKNLSFREKLVVYAKSLVGVKYVWAGSDPNGFDCSGFVGYVHKKYGIVIPRTASAQLAGAKKLKVNDAQKGDLIFFGSGGNISHVGLVITDKGNAIAMVHASTSKGVIITAIEESTYWKPKLKAAGTFI